MELHPITLVVYLHLHVNPILAVGSLKIIITMSSRATDSIGLDVERNQ